MNRDVYHDSNTKIACMPHPVLDPLFQDKLLSPIDRAFQLLQWINDSSIKEPPGLLPKVPMSMAAIRISESTKPVPLQEYKLYNALSAMGFQHCLPLSQGIAMVLGSANLTATLDKTLATFIDAEILSLGTAYAIMDIRYWIMNTMDVVDGFFYGKLCQCKEISAETFNDVRSGMVKTMDKPEELKEMIQKDLFNRALSQPPFPTQLKSFCLSILFEASRTYGSGSMIDCDAYVHADTLVNLNRIFLKDMLKISSEAAQSAIRKAISITCHQFSMPLTRAKIAEMVGLSPAYFSRLFHKETGQSYTVFLTAIRIKEATRLLRTTRMKVYEVGVQVGILNYRHFSILFKRYTGSNPSDVREKNNATK